MIRIILAGISVIGGIFAVNAGKRIAGAYRLVLSAITVLYASGFLYFTLFSRTLFSGSKVNLIPFYTVFRSLRYPVQIKQIAAAIITGKWNDVFTTFIPLHTAFLNILLFIPLGYLLPEWRGKEKNCIRTVVLTCLGVSCLVEFIQLLTAMGWCDVDDLICNVSGGMLGYAIHLIMIRNKKGQKGVQS
ncbi:MAG: VanZ family protein [Clostridia bacterium]|nr:VanZ family protein [Clostridia bacterium]